MTDTRTLFVYGTLRQGPGHAMHHLIARNGRSLGEARVRGRLFDLGEYPGMTLEDEGEVFVAGELYEITQNWDEVIARLDEYEGDEYRRERVTAVRAGGETVVAWAYVLIGDPRDLRRIESGDFLTR